MNFAFFLLLSVSLNYSVLWWILNSHEYLAAWNIFQEPDMSENHYKLNFLTVLMFKMKIGHSKEMKNMTSSPWRTTTTDRTNFSALFSYLNYMLFSLFVIARCQPVGCLPASVSSFLYFEKSVPQQNFLDDWILIREEEKRIYVSRNPGPLLDK